VPVTFLQSPAKFLKQSVHWFASYRGVWWFTTSRWSKFPALFGGGATLVPHPPCRNFLSFPSSVTMPINQEQAPAAGAQGDTHAVVGVSTDPRLGGPVTYGYWNRRVRTLQNEIETLCEEQHESDLIIWEQDWQNFSLMTQRDMAYVKIRELEGAQHPPPPSTVPPLPPRTPSPPPTPPPPTPLVQAAPVVARPAAHYSRRKKRFVKTRPQVKNPGSKPPKRRHRPL
jgi:hypothetical protein